MFCKRFGCLTFLSSNFFQVCCRQEGKKTDMQETELSFPPKANCTSCVLKYEVPRDRRLDKGVHQRALSPNLLQEVMKWRHWRQESRPIYCFILDVAYVCKVLFIKVIYVAVGLCGNHQDIMSKTTQGHAGMQTEIPLYWSTYESVPIHVLWPECICWSPTCFIQEENRKTRNFQIHHHPHLGPPSAKK